MNNADVAIAEMERVYEVDFSKRKDLVKKIRELEALGVVAGWKVDPKTVKMVDSVPYVEGGDVERLCQGGHQEWKPAWLLKKKYCVLCDFAVVPDGHGERCNAIQSIKIGSTARVVAVASVTPRVPKHAPDDIKNVIAKGIVSFEIVDTDSWIGDSEHRTDVRMCLLVKFGTKTMDSKFCANDAMRQYLEQNHYSEVAALYGIGPSSSAHKWGTLFEYFYVRSFEFRFNYLSVQFGAFGAGGYEELVESLGKRLHLPQIGEAGPVVSVCPKPVRGMDLDDPPSYCSEVSGDSGNESEVGETYWFDEMRFLVCARFAKVCCSNGQVS